eukprot:6179128-Pleurochrysis_carterae.AAC.1
MCYSPLLQHTVSLNPHASSARVGGHARLLRSLFFPKGLALCQARGLQQHRNKHTLASQFLVLCHNTRTLTV